MKLKNILLAGFFFVSFLPISSIAQKFALPGVVSSVTTREDWPVLRERIYEKIAKTWGESPVPYTPAKNSFKEVSRFERYGLSFIVYNYQVTSDSWDRGILVLPKDFDEKKKYPTVLAIHGTNGASGADGMFDMEKVRARAYAVDLANKGFVVFCPDHFGFGEHLKNKTQDEFFTEFEGKYPKWTITGRQVLGYVRAIDCVSQFPYVDLKKGVGVMGNSLGGRTSLFIMAFDERVGAGVVSTGVSPMISNTYRGMRGIRRQEKFYWEEVEKNANYAWDYTEMIALCAPRALMVIEPTNDPYNPFIEFTFRSIFGAMPVWKLYDHPEKLNFLMHGDGHDTVGEVRAFAYMWFERFLKEDYKPEQKH